MQLRLPKILQTQQMIQPYIRQTPLIRSPYLSQLSGADVWLKLENWQPTGSFKIRGALSKLSRLTEAQRQQGIVAASAGNHALGVAYAAEKLGRFSADIFVPGTAPKAKIDKLAYYPVTIHKAGDTYEDAHQAAANFAAETGALEISAYDDVDVVAGQASVGLEIFQIIGKIVCHQFAVVDDQNAAAECLHFLHDVCGENHRFILADTSDQLTDFQDLVWIQSGGRFIQYQYFGIVQQCLGESNPLTIAFGQGADEFILFFLKATKRDHFRHALSNECSVFNMK